MGLTEQTIVPVLKQDSKPDKKSVTGCGRLWKNVKSFCMTQTPILHGIVTVTHDGWRKLMLYYPYQKPPKEEKREVY
jgi:hypothetical protein